MNGEEQESLNSAISSGFTLEKLRAMLTLLEQRERISGIKAMMRERGGHPVRRIHGNLSFIIFADFLCRFHRVWRGTQGGRGRCGKRSRGRRRESGAREHRRQPGDRFGISAVPGSRRVREGFRLHPKTLRRLRNAREAGATPGGIGNPGTPAADCSRTRPRSAAAIRSWRGPARN